MGIDQVGMGEVEAEIVANPSQPLIPELKGVRKARRFDALGLASAVAAEWSITWRWVRTDFT